GGRGGPRHPGPMRRSLETGAGGRDGGRRARCGPGAAGCPRRAGPRGGPGRGAEGCAMTAAAPRTAAWLLGVDGGGTSTEAWLAEPGFRLLGRGTAGPSNAKAVGLEAARRALEAAIGAAFQTAGLVPAPVDVACLGLAGFDRPEDRAVLAGWADAACWAHRLVLVNDGAL